MDDVQEQDHYEERLKEVFNSFDASGSGSLGPEELSDLCQSLHLDDATPALMHTLLQDQDHLTARVDFDQFKNALIQVLSSSAEPPPPAETETSLKPESPEIQPKFVKGSKRYGRRTTPEFIEPFPGTPDIRTARIVKEEDLEDGDDSAVPRKRERWIAYEKSTEEYEAEGQLHLWNPDEPSTPRGAGVPLSSCLEERLREACDELEIPWDGCADHGELLNLCEHLSLEIHMDVLQNLTGDGVMNVQEFVSRVANQNKPPTPSSASTPYRQLKRHHSTQPFDEGGRRIATPSALSSTIGMRLFSTLDDGSGFTPVEFVLDAWLEEGIENSTEILQALNFSLDGKLSLSDLTMALENELLVTKNGIHQAALASFKAEIRHLLERVDRELREKEKIRSDLEKAEKQKSQLATEVDEHHSAIEQMNNLNLRKLEQEHREKLTCVRSELMKEMDLIQQQASLQREELEAEMEKIKEDESFLRDHLSISVKENRRLEMELLDSTEKLEEAQSQITKLQTNLDNIIKEKFGDLDPGSADLFLQEERIKQLRSSYEAQCRELQDRIDELQSELQEFHGLGRVLQPCHKTLSEELESKSPGMESDPGIGSDEVQPFSMSLEAEMMLEQLKEQHLQEMEDLRNQLESKINEFDKMVEKQRTTHEDQKATLVLQQQQELQALREETLRAQMEAQELQSRLEQVDQERTSLEQSLDKDRAELEELETLRRKLQEAQSCSTELEEKLKTLEAQQTESEEKFLMEMEELKKQHADEVRRLQEEHVEMAEASMEGERKKFQEENAAIERRLLEKYEEEKELVQQSHEEELKVRLEEVKVMFNKEREDVVQGLTDQWERERAQLDEHNNEALQVLLEEEMMRLVREQEEKEGTLKEQWERDRKQLQETLLQERTLILEQFKVKEKQLREEWEKERLQLEEDFDAMLQERLNEEREKLDDEKEAEEKRLQTLISEERALLEESHREAVKELVAKHAEERDALSGALEKLREDVIQERSETSRLAEENLILRQKIATLKEEDLKEAQEELIKKLEHFKKVKIAAQKSAENFKKQIAELRLHSQQLEDENGILSEKNAQNLVDIQNLRRQLAALTKDEEGNKNHILEVALQSSGLQNTKLLRDEVSRLLEQDQLLLKQENERLQAEVHDVKGDLLQSREKISELDATILSLKHNKDQSLSSELLEALEQENAVLKRELEAQRELNKGCEAGHGHAQMEGLQQENEALKAQMARMSSQIMESFQAHLVGLLPPSPHRMPRGQHRAEDPDNVQQDERERKMKKMEERMREIELSLRNVKLLLREKVAQLKDQLHKNGKADVLISDLYVENSQLLKALEITEKRHKIAEKKNYLLEEKISSLNRIVRELNPTLPYHY